MLQKKLLQKQKKFDAWNVVDKRIKERYQEH